MPRTTNYGGPGWMTRRKHSRPARPSAAREQCVHWKRLWQVTVTDKNIANNLDQRTQSDQPLLNIILCGLIFRRASSFCLLIWLPKQIQWRTCWRKGFHLPFLAQAVQLQVGSCGQISLAVSSSESASPSPALRLLSTMATYRSMPQVRYQQMPQNPMLRVVAATPSAPPPPKLQVPSDWPPNWPEQLFAEIARVGGEVKISKRQHAANAEEIAEVKRDVKRQRLEAIEQEKKLKLLEQKVASSKEIADSAEDEVLNMRSFLQGGLLLLWSSIRLRRQRLLQAVQPLGKLWGWCWSPSVHVIHSSGQRRRECSHHSGRLLSNSSLRPDELITTLLCSFLFNERQMFGTQLPNPKWNKGFHFPV